MPSIVIVGTAGAGKTVFVTCLAKCVQQGDKGVILDPQNSQTQCYVEEVWSTLQGGDWPPNTPPGLLPTLDWHLILPNCAPLDVRLFDPPGHDIRQLMAKGATLTEIPAQLVPLASSILTADIVILLVNLADVLGAPNDPLRIVSELVIKFVLDVIDRRDVPKRAALVFTQADQYPELLRANVALASVAQKHLPLVHQTLGARPWCQLFAVAAVAHTRATVDANGIARRFPVPGFQSQGFDPLLSWIKSRAKELHDREQGKRIAPWVFSVVGVIVLMMMLRIQWTKKVDPPPPPPPPRPPAGRIISSVAKYEYVGVFDYDVIVNVTVANDGGVGSVPVYVGLVSNSSGWADTDVNYISAGGSASFTIRFKEYRSGKARYCVSTKQDDLKQTYNYRPVPE